MSRAADTERGRHLRSNQEVEVLKQHSHKYPTMRTKMVLLEAVAAIHYGKEKVGVCTKTLSVFTTNQAK